MHIFIQVVCHFPSQRHSTADYYFNNSDKSCFHLLWNCGFSCALFSHTPSFSTTSKWRLFVANSLAVSPCLFFASNNSSMFSPTSLAQLHNVSIACKLPLSAAWCHAVYPYLSVASNNLLFNSFGFSCVSFAQTHNFWNNSLWFHMAAIFQTVSPLLLSASNHLFLKSSEFIFSSSAQPHTISNASKLPSAAARCHAVYPYWSLDSSNLFFN